MSIRKSKIKNRKSKIPMRDLLKLSDEELAELSARQRVRTLTAAGLAVAIAGLALAGMMARFSAGDEAPLPGMNHF